MGIMVEMKLWSKGKERKSLVTENDAHHQMTAVYADVSLSGPNSRSTVAHVSWPAAGRR